ncbi:hypothetical protein SAMN05216386_0835 [Nitrosospira briensis]|uniref:Uncharacterized protein n=1 Tax=Nitrosospira briensis TaxID=35799 RepID=A0A1I4YRD8_9PROT|nr:hypothetical protein [Nitrosospira briensis]SFN40333.1 hypothetical protein SAMN05216386_0835 [Nitrosospira briensis]
MKIKDKFVGSLPYSSEIFGVYQPLLGWKSERKKAKFNAGIQDERIKSFNKSLDQIQSSTNYDLDLATCSINLREWKAGSIDSNLSKENYGYGSLLLNALADKVKSFNETSDWESVINKENIDILLEQELSNTLRSAFTQDCKFLGNHNLRQQMLQEKYGKILNYESKVAGLLVFLASQKAFDSLYKIFKTPKKPIFTPSDRLNDPLDFFDPQKDLHKISLSPVGIVHLFRQYFFEFETFLGPAVEHIWLSPGAEAVLIEIHTRKTVIEKTLEQASETIIKSESSLTEKDEISEAVQENNKQDLKLGFTASVNQSWATGSANATGSLDFNTTQEISKETSHKRMREQTEKLSSEIKKNFKSTFKSVSEETATSSKKYTLKNSTNNLINYELRRKMRQVGVQVQDIGTYLCWQTYVDNPGLGLGLANLIHLAAPADLDSIAPAEIAPMPAELFSDVTLQIRFEPINADPNEFGLRKDRTYINGVEEDQSGDTYVGNDRIKHIQNYSINPPQTDYLLNKIYVVSTNNNLCDLSVIQISEDNNITIQLEMVNFNNQNEIPVSFKASWMPSKALKQKIISANDAAITAYDNKVDQLTKQAFVDGLKERVNFASRIESRKFEELREEERIIVYRNLIKSLIESTNSPDYSTSTSTQHIIAELINSIFDIDKMLYFVAPDWWKPKLTTQSFSSGFLSTLNRSFASWGGAIRDSNYNITEESEPAKLGSSLGWLLQLDGDNLRNAFLNAPWVKAVIPIRPGKEQAALNWLKHTESGEGLTENDFYTGDEEELQGKTIWEALTILAEKVREKHAAGNKVELHPKNEEINDDNKVSSTPIDKVYEHGFYPLQGGFKLQTSGHFEIFDQWVEILPTDQVVAVEVEYDPVTGMQKGLNG